MKKKTKEGRIHYQLSDDGKLVLFEYPQLADFQLKELFESAPDNPTTDDKVSLLKQLGVPDVPLTLSPEFQQPFHRAELLMDFIEVCDQDSLLEYLARRDIPDLRWSEEYEGQSLYRTELFFASAASLYWLLLLLDEVQKGSVSSRLRNWTKVKQYDERLSITFAPTDQDLNSKYLRHWHGNITLIGRNFGNRETFVSNRCDPQSESLILDCAKGYLAGHINELVTDMSPRLAVWSRSNELVSQIGVRTTYEAVCFALYEKACGSSTVRTCRNPHCPNPIYIAKSKSGNRKPRSDRHYCSRAGCQSWGYENLGRVRAAHTKERSLKRGKR